MGGLIGSRLTAPDLRETSLVLSPIRFAPLPHKYMMSLAPLLLTLPTFAFSALERLLRTEEESTGEKKGEGGGKAREREREREIARARLTAVATFSTAPMAGGAVVL